jgi:hypothetical protein
MAWGIIVESISLKLAVVVSLVINWYWCILFAGTGCRPKDGVVFDSFFCCSKEWVSSCCNSMVLVMLVGEVLVVREESRDQVEARARGLIKYIESAASGCL